MPVRRSAGRRRVGSRCRRTGTPPGLGRERRGPPCAHRRRSRSPGSTPSIGAKWVCTKWYSGRASSSPTADRSPGAGGTTTVRTPRERAISAACTGPLPPKAMSEKSRGSRPLYVETARMALIIVTLATTCTPYAASSSGVPSGDATLSWSALADRSGLSRTAPPASSEGLM